MSLKHLVDELILALHGRTAKEPLTQESFQRWCQEFIFDAIKNQRFGEAFCIHFGIMDNHVFYETNIEKCKSMIRERYL